jgi:hypothetical protein
MKKMIMTAGALLLLVAAFATRTPDVTEKVLNAFNRTFYAPQDIRWFSSEDGGFEVYFKCDNIRSKVWYDEEGNIKGTLRYYGEYQLPPMVLAKMQKKYSGKTVLGVTEISNETGLSYYIRMEDAKNLWLVKAEADGSADVVEKLRKTLPVK